MGGSTSREPPAVRTLPEAVLPSRYQQRVARLVDEVAASSHEEPLERTLRRCIAFCYQVTEEWAPFVRVTVFADNVNEHQLNVPVYHALLCCFGEPGFEKQQVKCKAVAATDVADGLVRPSVFWTRRVARVAGLHWRDLGHWLLKWFADLEDADPRKQLLVNLLLQMHEACFNCVGRHKEVFEYGIYDLLESEHLEDSAGCKRVVCDHAAAFLDRHKRNALHAAFLSPLKFIFQDIYEVFENLDGHGASFWVGVLRCFFPHLDMPFEDIDAMEMGWTWGAVDFLCARDAASTRAFARFAEPTNLSLDWRTLTRDLRPGGGAPRFRGLPFRPGPAGFKEALRRIRQQPAVQSCFLRYVDRFSAFFQRPVLLERWALSVVTSERWPQLSGALAELRQAPVTREELCSAEGEVNLVLASTLLTAAGVPWAEI